MYFIEDVKVGERIGFLYKDRIEEVEFVGLRGTRVLIKNEMNGVESIHIRYLFKFDSSLREKLEILTDKYNYLASLKSLDPNSFARRVLVDINIVEKDYKKFLSNVLSQIEFNTLHFKSENEKLNGINSTGTSESKYIERLPIGTELIYADGEVITIVRFAGIKESGISVTLPTSEATFIGVSANDLYALTEKRRDLIYKMNSIQRDINTIESLDFDIDTRLLESNLDSVKSELICDLFKTELSDL